MLVVGVLTLLAIAVGPAGAAHNGNNRADLTGHADGRAVVNYSAGQGTFNATVNVRGLDAGNYAFAVSLNGANRTEVCEIADGATGCSAQGLALPGFNTAEIVAADGEVVASGVFDRGGNCRDPQQGGTLCEANDPNPNR